MQDGATSHTAAVTQNDLSEKFGRRFIQKGQWPPTPHIVSNPLDYSFWDAVKLKVYEGRITSFSNIKELKDRIRRVWKRACNIDVLRKSILQFRSQLNAVVKEKGRPIKSDFG